MSEKMCSTRRRILEKDLECCCPTWKRTGEAGARRSKQGVAGRACGLAGHFAGSAGDTTRGSAKGLGCKGSHVGLESLQAKTANFFFFRTLRDRPNPSRPKSTRLLLRPREPHQQHRSCQCHRTAHHWVLYQKKDCFNSLVRLSLWALTGMGTSDKGFVSSSFTNLTILQEQVSPLIGVSSPNSDIQYVCSASERLVLRLDFLAGVQYECCSHRCCAVIVCALAHLRIRSLDGSVYSILDRIAQSLWMRKPTWNFLVAYGRVSG